MNRQEQDLADKILKEALGCGTAASEITKRGELIQQYVALIAAAAQRVSLTILGPK